MADQIIMIFLSSLTINFNNFKTTKFQNTINDQVADPRDTPPGIPFQGARRSPLELPILPGGHNPVDHPQNKSQIMMNFQRKIFTLESVSFVTRRAGPGQRAGSPKLARGSSAEGKQQEDLGSRKTLAAGKTSAAGKRP